MPISKTPKNLKVKNGIQIGQTIKIIKCSNDEILTVKICGINLEKKYKRMGGSHYGNFINISHVGDNMGFEDGIFNVSALPPFLGQKPFK